jgi:hypothetical protein
MTGLAQERPLKNPARPIPFKRDSSRVTPPDNTSTQVPASNDTLAIQSDSIPKSDIETTINYVARDSIRVSLDGKLIWLYGDAQITYGQIELQAEEVIIDYGNSTITAMGVRDSLGNRIGYPIFKDGPEMYETKGIIYNFKTKRARIKEVVTKQGEGFLVADAAFKNEANEILSVRNSYTTCDLEHPHYRIRATKTKAIPDDKIVAGPFYVEFNDIPLPAGFLFGMFPAQRESKSGIIFPSYGEEKRRGFNLRSGGYFFDISEYIKLGITGDIYSKGGHALYANSTYMKKYAYSGNFNFSYSKNRLGDNIEDRDVQNDFRLTWSHSPQSKGTSRFAASVNAATATFNKFNNLMYGTPGELNSQNLNNISTNLSSNVSFNKRFAGTPFSLGVNLNHTQNLSSRLVDLNLPNITLNMTNIYPFQRPGKVSKLDNFSLGYSMQASNKISNNIGKVVKYVTNSAGKVSKVETDSIAPFVTENLPLFFENARNGVQHSIPISYSFKALRFFTVSPSVSYTERWYLKQLNWGYRPDSTFVADTSKTFNRIANYSVSASLQTRMYGMYFFNNPNSKVKAIRHIINPSISFGYTPDFSKNDDYFDPLVDKSGNTQYLSKHQGFAYQGSTIGKAGSIGFGIGNNLEMKVKSEKDTVERKVMLLNSLSISSSYNLLADSFKLAPIGLSANTSLLNNKLNVNFSAGLDPYRVLVYVNEETGERNEVRTRGYAWYHGRIGRITNATMALSTNLNPKARESQADTREKIAGAEIPEEQKNYLMQNAQHYIDFDIPWSLNIGYTLSYNDQLDVKARIIQTLNFSGDLSLSEKWKVTFNSGYHFEEKEFTQTNLGISRDVHCWTMNVNWVPFGPFQSYNFTLAVKASILKDLKLERRRPFLDNR